MTRSLRNHRSTLASLGLAMAFILGGAQGQKLSDDPLADLAQGTTEMSRTVTKNGVRIVSVRDDDVRKLHIAMLLGAGARHDPEFRPGLANFISECLVASIPEELEEQLRTSMVSGLVATDHEHIILQVAAPPKEWRVAVAWLAACLRPDWDTDSLLAARRSATESLSIAAHRRIAQRNAILYGELPFGRSVVGDRDSLRNIHKRDIEEFHRQHFVGGNVMITISGRAPLDECTKALTEATAHLQPGQPNRRPVGRYRYQGTRGHPFIPGTARPAVAEVGFYLPAASPRDVVHQLVLQHLLVDRLGETTAAVTEVDIHWLDGASRMSVIARTPDPSDLPEIASSVHSAAALTSTLTSPRVDRAIRAAAEHLVVRDADGLVHAAKICWQFEALGGRCDHLPALINKEHVSLGAIRNQSQRLLGSGNSYAFLSKQPLPAYLLPTVLGILLLLVLIDRYRGFPIAHGIASLLRIQRARRQEAAEQAAVQPMSGDELAERIQEFYAEQDRES